jgi:hypothetical protein
LLRSILSLSFLLCLLAGCTTTGVRIPNTPLSLTETRRTVAMVIGEPRFVSVNGRELLSKYYDQKQQPIENMALAKERYFTHVIILGDRRPYDVTVDVVMEERDEDGRFQATEKNDEMAAPIADKLKKQLYQNVDSRNLIDDFRSF